MRIVTVGWLCGLAGPAWAQTYAQSVDIELVHARPGCDAWTGVESAPTSRTPCLGLSLQGARAPLVLYDDGERVGDLVPTRFTFQLGGSVAHGDRFTTVFGAPPIATTVGSLTSVVAAGDPLLGERVLVVSGDGLAVAAKLDLKLPLGTKDEWLGEEGLRLGAGAVATASTGRLAADLDATLWLRKLFSLWPRTKPLAEGLEARLGVAGRWTAVVDRLDLYVAATSRLAIASPGIEARARPVEGLVGTRFRAGPVRVDLAVGRGLLRGAGTTTYRVVGGVTVDLVSRPPDEDDPTDPPPAVVEVSLPTPLPVAEAGIELRDTRPPPPPAPKPSPPPPIREDPLTTKLLETLYFEVASTELLDESQGDLVRLIAGLHANPHVGPVLLEGHASEEGDVGYNYRLSLGRADAIYAALIEAGISPRRLVLRPLGEVDPTPGAEPRLARRVEIRWVLDSTDVPDDLPNPLTGLPTPKVPR